MCDKIDIDLDKILLSTLLKKLKKYLFKRRILVYSIIFLFIVLTYILIKEVCYE